MEGSLIFKRIDSQDLLLEVYRLRFQVYCKERHFIDESDCPNGYETDEFDKSALHFGAFDLSGQIIGTVRLIFPSCEKFPVEKLCADLKFGGSMPPRTECAEISRLTISKLYRKRTEGEKASSYIHRVSPIVIGLCDEIYQSCRRSAITHALALMEKPLWTLLKLQGFIFDPIGPEVDFFGKVTPYLGSALEFEKRGVFKNSHPMNVS